jgi:hypothetical protein
MGFGTAGQLGHAGVRRKGKQAWPTSKQNRFRPIGQVEKENAFKFYKSIYKSKPFDSNSKFQNRTTPIRKIKYGSTSSHNKICSGMNATNNHLFK